MASLKEVAQRANVSLATASRVLSASTHSSARYSQATRQAVVNASQELGYKPNLPARALASGRSNIVAVVYPRVLTSPFSAPFVMKLIEHIERVCSEHGFHVLLSAPRIEESQPEESYLKLINSGYLDGIICIDSFQSSSLLAHTLESGLPAIITGTEDCLVHIDETAGAYELAKHVLALGHRDIGFIGVPDELNHRAQVRFEGFQRALDEVGLELPDLPREDGDFSLSSGEQAAHTLLAHHPELTVIMALNDFMAVGAYRAARNLKRLIPDDLVVTGYDDMPIATELVPSLTTVHQPIDQLGERLASKLIDLIEGKEPPQEALTTTLQVRESTSFVQELMPS
ncbi:MAG: LacI family DNA-binding transcriptional regulator [Deinococcota bacterium]